MTTRLALTAPVLALTLLLASTGCSAPTASTDAASSTDSDAPAATTDPIIGEWTMATLEFQTDGQFEDIPFSGQIIFTEAGTVSVQAQNPDTSAPDTAYTVQGYEAFYGDAEIDEDAGTFSVDVVSAAARDLIGQTLTRNYEVTDDTLVLTPIDPAEGWRVTYDRADS